MTPSALCRLVVAGCLAVTGFACGGSSSPTAPTSTSTDVFTATLGPAGVVTHPFSLSGPGAISVSIDTISAPGLVVGLGLGDWNATTSICTLQLSSATAKQGDVFNASSSVAGNFCIQVVDLGSVQEPVTYTVRVTHP